MLSTQRNYVAIVTHTQLQYHPDILSSHPGYTISMQRHSMNTVFRVLPLATKLRMGLYLKYTLFEAAPLTHFLLYSEEMIKRLAAFLIYTCTEDILNAQPVRLNCFYY
jgi:hypothetical protein